MCGIAVVISRHRAPYALETVATQMVSALVHRGPDGEGVRAFSSQDFSVALGHRRLSIIDLAGGGQPMANETGRVWITYNGEVYNHNDLREELMAMGHRFSSRSDTETIVHAYEEWGTECVERLRGMFAFAVWDQERETLFAARDRMGIKPLYYAQVEDLLLIASEIKAILATGWLQPEIAMEALPEQMTFGYLVGEQTLFRGVKKLLPGHWLTWKHGAIQTQQYWDTPAPLVDVRRSEADYVAEFTELFQESVRLRLMSDVPLGVFLSGGLDSSSIAATMAEHVHGRLKTFSVGFQSPYYSELAYAREVAEALGSDHHEVVLTPETFFESLPKLVWHEDEPIRSAPSVALYHVAELAREHVKVVLTGEGSDELFAGYDRYWATLFNFRWGRWYNRFVPRSIRERCLRNTLWHWPVPLSLKKKLSHTFIGRSLRPEDIVFDNWYAIFPRDMRQELFSQDVNRCVQDVNPYENSMRIWESRDKGNTLDQLLYTDQKTYLVELLMKQDNMSMAASIESRVPFLDHHLVEFATRVPGWLKVRGAHGKHLVKRAMMRMLPESIRRREKTGFPVPFREWLAQPFGSRFIKQIALSPRARERNLLNQDYVHRLFAEHAAGLRDHTEPLWTITNLELWARLFLDGQHPDDVRDEMSTLQPSQSAQRSGRACKSVAAVVGTNA
jgi:asparagine synthase (glutamine-hydrolysing)